MRLEHTLLPFVGQALADRWLSSSQTVRGVNLGSLFVIEPWLSHDTWNQMGCGQYLDEWSCVAKLGQNLANTKFADHWNTWITQDDIQEIKSYGLNTIRIPVGFWIDEELVDRSQEHYPEGGLPFLDRVVGWAADAGLYVIIDLHGAPGSQTTSDYTGHVVPSPEFYTPANYERAYSFLKWMTQRIHQKNEYRTVGVLEVLNEPVRYGTPGDAANMIASMLKDFYPNAYSTIRAEETSLGVPDSDQIKIEFMSTSWGSGDPTSHLPKSATGLLFDDHKYYAFGKNYTTQNEVIHDVCTEKIRPKDWIFGEVSTAIKHEQSNMAFTLDPKQTDDLEGQKEWYKSFWGTQASFYEQAGGWIFWTWKCESMTPTGSLTWCYQNAVKNGLIPEDASAAADMKACGK